MNVSRDRFLVDAERAFRETFPDRWESLLRAAERAWAAPIPRERHEFPPCRTVRVGSMNVDVLDVTVRFLHAGAIETGNGWLNARFQSTKLRQRERPGVLVLGLDELDRIAERRDVEEWSPGEVVTATLYTYSSELVVIWLQECGSDPFRRLAEIAAGLDWNAHARLVPAEE